MKVAIIGGGAAGFFAAISAKEHHKEAEVIIYEKSNKLLAKVKVSGGGRCNVTNACFSISELSKFYPRGGKQLKKAFGHFYTKDTVSWFETRNVSLKAEADNRMFPTSNDSQTIIDCLENEAQKLGVSIFLQSPISKITKQENGFLLQIKEQEFTFFDKVIIATGGKSKLSNFDWLKNLGHKIEPPVPSLFTFNMPKNEITSLMGVVANNTSVRVQGTKLQQSGSLLITHWGMSGPAILKLSAWGARVLSEMNYQFKTQINWINFSEQEAKTLLSAQVQEHSKRKVSNKNPFQLSARLWEFLLAKIDLKPNIVWGEIGKKNTNRLLNILLNDVYEVSGKTTFKEEFVTCGGLSLQEVNMSTMESRICPNLYFAGEVLDIDGVTGGFNFQAAWTTGFIAGKCL